MKHLEKNNKDTVLPLVKNSLQTATLHPPQIQIKFGSVNLKIKNPLHESSCLSARDKLLTQKVDDSGYFAPRTLILHNSSHSMDFEEGRTQQFSPEIYSPEKQIPYTDSKVANIKLKELRQSFDELVLNEQMKEEIDTRLNALKDFKRSNLLKKQKRLSLEPKKPMISSQENKGIKVVSFKHIQDAIQIKAQQTSMPQKLQVFDIFSRKSYQNATRYPSVTQNRQMAEEVAQEEEYILHKRASTSKPIQKTLSDTRRKQLLALHKFRSLDPEKEELQRSSVTFPTKFFYQQVSQTNSSMNDIICSKPSTFQTSSTTSTSNQDSTSLSNSHTKAYQFMQQEDQSYQPVIIQRNKKGQALVKKAQIQAKKVRNELLKIQESDSTGGIPSSQSTTRENKNDLNKSFHNTIQISQPNKEQTTIHQESPVKNANQSLPNNSKLKFYQHPPPDFKKQEQVISSANKQSGHFLKFQFSSTHKRDPSFPSYSSLQQSPNHAKRNTHIGFPKNQATKEISYSQCLEKQRRQNQFHNVRDQLEFCRDSSEQIEINPFSKLLNQRENITRDSSYSNQQKQKNTLINDMQITGESFKERNMIDNNEKSNYLNQSRTPFNLRKLLKQSKKETNIVIKQRRVEQTDQGFTDNNWQNHDWNNFSIEEYIDLQKVEEEEK